MGMDNAVYFTLETIDSTWHHELTVLMGAHLIQQFRGYAQKIDDIAKAHAYLMANAATTADMEELRKAQRAQLVSAWLTEFRMGTAPNQPFSDKHHVG